MYLAVAGESHRLWRNLNSALADLSTVRARIVTGA
jgi:hypothetical protein